MTCPDRTFSDCRNYMRLLPAEALLNNTRRLCISPSSGNRPWMGGCHSLFFFRNTHGQGVRQLSIPLLSSQRSSPPASEMCSVQPSLFPETEPERHESLPIRSYHCLAKPECHGFPCVTSFQPAISHRLWKSSPPHQKRYADLRHLPQAVSNRAADCRRAGLQHGRYSPTARPVSGISTAGKRLVLFPSLS